MDLPALVYVQTMARQSRVDPRRLVFSDLENVTPEGLARDVSILVGQGWGRHGASFTRTYQKRS